MMNALIRFNSVGNSFVILLILLSQFQIRPASGLQCYECTSEKQFCNTRVAVTPSLKKECEADAVACGIYAFYYDFFIGTIYHRSCIYSYDLYNETTGKGWIVLDKDGYDTRSGPDNLYDQSIGIWDELRKQANPSAPSVLQVKRFPPAITGHYHLRVFLQQGSLSNGEAFQQWTWPGFTREQIPVARTIECYSCEFAIKGIEIIAYQRAPSDYRLSKDEVKTYNLPPCGSKDPSKLKKVTCEDAYGCATLLEIKNASNAMYLDGRLRENFNNSVAQVWRGCWYPGEQKCLRDPESVLKSRSLESLKGKMRSGGERQTDTQTADCDKAYRRSFETGKGVVVWAGVKPIESSDEYNKYLECRHKARQGVRAESQLTLVTEKVDTEYTWIQYQFCGPKSKCNRYTEVDGDHVGKAKYNPKDYEEFEEKVDDKKGKNVTKLDGCDTEDESVGDEKNASAVLIGFDKILNVFLLITIFLLQ